MANATSLVKFGSSTKGRGIKIAATATPGTTVHTTGNVASVIEKIRLYLQNNHTTVVDAVIEFGGTTDPDDCIKISNIPAKSGLFLALNDLPLIDGGAGALDVKVYCSVANVLVAFGQVLKVTP